MAESPIQGFLFDLNGVFYVENQAIAGAAEAIKLIKERQIPCRFVTNTTTKSLESFHQKLTNLGLPINKEEVISAPYAAVLYLKQLGNPKCYLLLEEDAKRDFAQFPQSDTDPDVIVIGDIGDRWNYDLMNQAFTLLNNGAELVALHKGKYWQEVSPVRSWRFPSRRNWRTRRAGLRLDIGAFVAGLEYATGKTATVVGKPSSSFFRLALDDLGLAAEQVAMVGDDIESDVGGAKEAGLTGILVKTGKYREELVKDSTVQPDRVLKSVAEIEEVLD